MRRTVARFVAVPALAGLLTEPAGLDDAVGDRRAAAVRVLRLEALPYVVADIQPRDVRHDKRADRVAEIDHHLVDLLGQRAFLYQEVHLGAERAAAAVGDKPV